MPDRTIQRLSMSNPRSTNILTAYTVTSVPRRTTTDCFNVIFPASVGAVSSQMDQEALITSLVSGGYRSVSFVRALHTRAYAGKLHIEARIRACTRVYSASAKLRIYTRVACSVGGDARPCLWVFEG
jgi:hypothetical protein